MATNTIKLKIPPQDFPDFNRFKADRQGAISWLSALPPGDPEEAAGLLTAALDEFTRHPLAPELRYEVAEVLRPAVEGVISDLSRQFYNLPPVIPKETLQLVERADQLCTLIGTVYTVVAVETIRAPESIQNTAPAQLACESLYRAISCTGQQVLQSLKLYRPLHMNGWLTLHQLYALAENQQLADLPIPEPLDAGSTITSAYLQAVLVACCKPNQLRQTDISALFNALGIWSEVVTLSKEAADSDVYLVDLQSDLPPLHREFYTEKIDASCRFIDTKPLLEKFRELKDAATESGIERDSRLSTGVIDHLVAALAGLSKRIFKRSRSNGKLSVALGMRNAHFYIAREKTFEQVLYGVTFLDDPENTGPEFTEAQPHVDVWHRANPAEDFIHSQLSHPDQAIELDAVSHARVLREKPIEADDETDAEDVDVSNYTRYDLQLADISPGGYCLEWNESGTGEVRNGDIVSIQEEHSQQWSVAAIRWLTRVDDRRMLFGLELLSPGGESYCACIHEADGQKSPPTYTLLLPEVKVVGQPATLVTPRANFRTGQKVTVLNSSERRTVQLTQLVDATGSYMQFEFKAIRELGDVLNESGSSLANEDDSSLWSTI